MLLIHVTNHFSRINVMAVTGFLLKKEIEKDQVVLFGRRLVFQLCVHLVPD